jgi:hypothetical protein
VEHRDPVCDAEDDLHVVLDEEHGQLLLARDPLDHLDRRFRLDRREPGRGLVEEQES